MAIVIAGVSEARADAVEATVVTGMQPWAIAVDSARNRVYVANQSDPALSR